MAMGHIIPKRLGGHADGPLLPPCNHIKADLMPDERDRWRADHLGWWPFTRETGPVSMDMMKEALEKMCRGPKMKDGPDWNGHNSRAFGVAAGELRQFIEQFERLEAEKKDVAETSNRWRFVLKMVRVEGLEPPRLAAPEPKSGASANFATPASARAPNRCRGVSAS